MKTVHEIKLTDEYIAEAQRIAIRHNRSLRLLYGSGWLWWMPRGVLLVGIAFLLFERLTSVIWIPAAFLLASIFGELSVRTSLARARERTKGRGSTTIVSLDDDAVQVIGMFSDSQIQWEGLSPPVILPDGVLMRFSRASGLWLPDRALIEGSAAEVRQLMTTHIGVSNRS